MTLILDSLSPCIDTINRITNEAEMIEDWINEMKAVNHKVKLDNYWLRYWKDWRGH